jgi:SAM-dependent MidA family methyltransferase
MEQALYRPDGFYRRPDSAPREHFRTSVHASPLFAAALMRLIVDVDRELGLPARLTVVDVGAGRGELLHQLVSWLTRPETDELANRIELVGVDLVGRPPELPASIRWAAQIPGGVTGVIVANEWLDNVAVDVVMADAGRWHVVLVDPVTGEEELGPPASGQDAGWLTQWWPRDPPEDGERAEVGRPRDRSWADTVSRLDRGVALAVDYAHLRAERADGAWAAGSLAAFRNGQEVPPVPDGSCDLTAHVAIDACAAAGVSAGAGHTVLTSQRAALRALGVHGTRPPVQLATDHPADYVAALSRASHEAELIDPDGLGGFSWLVQSKGVPIPGTLTLRSG